MSKPGPYVLTPRTPGRWAALGTCRNHPEPELWFPDGADGHRAKRICHTCPVQRQCLEYALDANEQHGVWGGTSERERRRLRRERAKAKRAA